MQSDNPYILTTEENRAIFITRIVPAFFSYAAHLKMPELHLVGGQPGSGKSYLVDEITIDLKNQFGVDSVVSIIGDDLRPFHPYYEKLIEINPHGGADLTTPDVEQWIEQAIALTAKQGNCVIIEGTLRKPKPNIMIASHYLKHSFSVHLNVPVVHEFLSRLRVFSRYFDQVNEKGVGRYAPPEIHDRAYKKLPESLAALIDSSLFKTITLYDQRQKPIFAINLPEKGASQNVLTVLEKYRNNKNVNTTDILLGIDRLLPQAKGHGQIYSDLLELRNEVSSIEKHFIPNVPYQLNETMQNMGCRWDAETKQWYHADPATAREAAQLVEQSPHRRPAADDAPSPSGFNHEM